jgi:hypothetical protein
MKVQLAKILTVKGLISIPAIIDGSLFVHRVEKNIWAVSQAESGLQIFISDDFVDCKLFIYFEGDKEIYQGNQIELEKKSSRIGKKLKEYALLGFRIFLKKEDLRIYQIVEDNLIEIPEFWEVNHTKNYI